MRKTLSFLAAFLMTLASPLAAQGRIVCTVAVELGSAAPLVRDGACAERISSASTFKIAISLMGFDSGIFTAPDAPEWPFREGYADWNPKWRQATTPATWMRDSVVWYSQQATTRLGARRFEKYVHDFAYGNQDVSGDAGKDNGLTRAWLSSSLQISPDEQVAFLMRMIEGELPVSSDAVQQTRTLLHLGAQPGGWQVYGKTGAGLPIGTDGALLRGQPFGWYVGWAERESRTVVFARLMRFDARPNVPAGFQARDSLLTDLFGADGILN